MAEYIAKEAVISYIAELFTICNESMSNEYGQHFIVEEELQIFSDNVVNIPAADVVPVRHGLWLTKEYMYGDPAVGVPDAWVDRRAEQSDYFAWCSLCGGDAPFTSEASLILSDWCPNCGALMDAQEVDNVDVG